MGHMLVVGMTESGKTTLSSQLVQTYRKNNIKVVVLDPMNDPRWGADFQTRDRAQFLSIIKNPETRSCAIFVDESAEMIGRYHEEMFFLATRGRHYGHNCHFVCQRAKQLAKTVRDQCSYLALFNCSFDDSRELANEFNRVELKNAHTLKKGEYFFCPRWGNLEKRKVF